MYNAPINPYAQNVSIIKGYFRKVLILILAVLQFLGTALSVTAALLLTTWSTHFLQSLLSQLSADASSMGLSDIQSMVGFSVVSSYLSLIPSAIGGVLVAVGYLFLFIKSRSKNPDSNPRPGATILFVLALIEMILSIIATVVLVISFIIAAVGISVSASRTTGYNSFNAGSVILTVGLSAALYIFLMLFYTVNKMRYFKSIKNSCSSTNLYTDGAGAFGVMNIIYAVMSLLSIGVIALLIPLSSWAGDLMGSDIGASMTSAPVTSIVAIFVPVVVISVVYQILTAIVAFGYKNYINKIKYNYKPAEVPEAPYQPEVKPQFTAPVSYSQPQNSYPQPTAQTPAPSVSTPTYCPACSSPVDADADFCSGCGYKLK